jgi:hypothetical protein
MQHQVNASWICLTCKYCQDSLLRLPWTDYLTRHYYSSSFTIKPHATKSHTLQALQALQAVKCNNQDGRLWVREAQEFPWHCRDRPSKVERMSNRKSEAPQHSRRQRDTDYASKPTGCDWTPTIDDIKPAMDDMMRSPDTDDVATLVVEEGWDKWTQISKA